MAAERHTHTAPDGTVYEHTHEHEYAQEHGHIHEHEHSHDGNGEHEHGHAHTHTHANTKAVLNRLSRAIGHLESIRRMVEERHGVHQRSDGSHRSFYEVSIKISRSL